MKESAINKQRLLDLFTDFDAVTIEKPNGHRARNFKGGMHWTINFGSMYSTEYSVGSGIVDNWIRSNKYTILKAQEFGHGRRRGLTAWLDNPQCVDGHEWRNSPLTAEGLRGLIRPDLVDILGCLMLDAESYDNSGADLDTFATEMDMQGSVTRAIAGFDGCRKANHFLRVRLGTSYDAAGELLRRLDGGTTCTDCDGAGFTVPPDLDGEIDCELCDGFGVLDI
jgi:hypothetical protein